MSEVEATNEVVDLDWDSDIEDFPTMEVTEEVSDEEDNSSDVDEVEDIDSEEAGDEPSEESSEDAGEADESKEEDKSGEQETPAINIEDLSDDAKISVKVDGELKEISLKEYKSGISGEKAIAKRFSEYDQKEKALKSEIEEINSYVNTFSEKMGKGDPVAALEYLSQFAGIPAYAVKDMLINKLMPEIQRRQELMPEELEVEKTKAQLDYEKKRSEEEKGKFEKERAATELQLKISTAQRSQNIKEDEWDNAYKHLDSTLPPEESITVETVKEYVLFSRAQEAVSTVDSKLIDDQGIMNAFVKVQMENPDFTHEDLIAVAKEAFSNADADKVTAKLQEVEKAKSGSQTKSAKQTKKAPQAQVESMSDEIDDWDDLL